MCATQLSAPLFPNVCHKCSLPIFPESTPPTPLLYPPLLLLAPFVSNLACHSRLPLSSSAVLFTARSQSYLAQQQSVLTPCPDQRRAFRGTSARSPLRKTGFVPGGWVECRWARKLERDFCTRTTLHLKMETRHYSMQTKTVKTPKLSPASLPRTGWADEAIPAPKPINSH